MRLITTLSYIPSLKQLDGLLNVSILEHILKHQLLSVHLVLVTIRVLRKDEMNDSNPVLVEVLLADFVCADIISTEPLHSKVVDEPICLQILHVYQLNIE